jgi:endonuclease YncB( thermonuclease family)
MGAKTTKRGKGALTPLRSKEKQHQQLLQRIRSRNFQRAIPQYDVTLAPITFTKNRNLPKSFIQAGLAWKCLKV